LFQITNFVCGLVRRHRLVVPKYNPARTVTPEGAVGLGGAYMCVYPMDSPGGYQLIGRTLPIWSTFGRVGPFSPAKPWLLNNFDQARGGVVLLAGGSAVPVLQGAAQGSRCIAGT
jgi:allophanate hydrolase subunit 1